MFKKSATAILITGLMMFTASLATAQTAPQRTSATVAMSETSIDTDRFANPILFARHFDQRTPPVTHKRLALDPSIQELKWAAAHGPRRELLEQFVTRQAASAPEESDIRMARVGGSVDSWTDILAGQPRSTPQFRTDGLTVSLIGPDSTTR